MNIYHDFTRANSEYLARADESGLDITNDLTVGAWVYFDAESTDVATGIAGKWNTNFVNQASYLLYKDANNKFVFSISADGSTVVSVDDGGANYEESQWFYIVGKFDPSTEMAIFVNGMWYRKTSGVPLAIHSGSAAFEIGRYSQSNYLDGRVSQAFLSNYFTPDVFVCAMYAHSRALYMNRTIYNRPCSSTSSSSTTSSSSSTTSSSTTSSSTSAPP